MSQVIVHLIKLTAEINHPGFFVYEIGVTVFPSRRPCESDLRKSFQPNTFLSITVRQMPLWTRRVWLRKADPSPAL